MDTLFDADECERIVCRIESLSPAATRQWGRMDAAQALAHCAAALEGATGDRPLRQKFIGKVLGPLFRRKLLGPEPFARNAPTDAALVVSDARDLARERARLLAAIRKFVAGGREAAARYPHAFLGRLSGDEWGRIMRKHLDHHLRQFGA